MKKLHFVGIDDWDRPVYKDDDGVFWKDINLGNGEPYFHNSSDGTVDGEPDMPMHDDYEICRDEKKQLNRYRVYGHTSVTVTIEVTAENEEQAYEEAANLRIDLDAYVGNGGTDKLIGVDGEDEAVNADNEIEYDDIELLGLAETDEDEEDEEDDK